MVDKPYLLIHESTLWLLHTARLDKAPQEHMQIQLYSAALKSCPSPPSPGTTMDVRPDFTAPISLHVGAGI